MSQILKTICFCIFICIFSTASFAATEVKKSQRCPSGFVHMKVKRDVLRASYRLEVDNRTSNEVTVVAKVSSVIVGNYEDAGRVESGRKSLDVPPESSKRESIIATLLNYGDVTVHDLYVSSCGTPKSIDTGKVVIPTVPKGQGGTMGSGGGGSQSINGNQSTSKSNRSTKPVKKVCPLKWNGRCVNRCPNGTQQVQSRCVRTINRQRETTRRNSSNRQRKLNYLNNRKRLLQQQRNRKGNSGYKPKYKVSQAPVNVGLKGNRVQRKEWNKRLNNAVKRGGWRAGNKELNKIKQEVARAERYRIAEQQRTARIREDSRRTRENFNRRWEAKQRHERERQKIIDRGVEQLKQSCMKTNTCEYMQLIMAGLITGFGVVMYTSYSIDVMEASLDGRAGGEEDALYKIPYSPALWGLSFALSSNGKYKIYKPATWKTRLFGTHGEKGVWNSMKEGGTLITLSTGIGMGYDHYTGLLATPILEGSEQAKVYNDESAAFDKGVPVNKHSFFTSIPFTLRLSWLRIGWYTSLGTYTSATHYEFGLQPFGYGLISPFVSLLPTLEHNNFKNDLYFVDRDRTHFMIGNEFNLLQARSGHGVGVWGISLQVAYVRNLLSANNFKGTVQRDPDYFLFNLKFYNGWDF